MLDRFKTIRQYYISQFNSVCTAPTFKLYTIENLPVAKSFLKRKKKRKKEKEKRGKKRQTKGLHY